MYESWNIYEFAYFASNAFNGKFRTSYEYIFFYFMFQIGSDIRLKYLFVLRAVEVIIIDVSREKRAWINYKVENIF